MIGPLSQGLIAQALDAVPRLRLLCIGDVMLDVEVPCANGRRSPEAPILVFEEQRHSARPGGAANVAANVAALGASVRLGGAIGRDAEGDELVLLVRDGGVEADFLHLEGHDHPTTRKTRFLADGRQLLRIDRERIAPLSEHQSDQLIEGAWGADEQFDAVLLADYGKGVVTDYLARACLARAERAGTPVLVDPKGNDWARYGPVDLIKPNADELKAFTGLACESDDAVALALACALELCAAKAILVTRAGRGAALLVRGEPKVQYLAARPVEVADVCGAGDTNLAVLGALVASGMALGDAAAVAQIASSLAVQRQGNAVIGARDILAALEGPPTASARKRHDLDALLEAVALWRARGMRIGFTNGCFDLLHPGHLHVLETARSQCDRLIVGLNSDASVRRLKGPDRPVMNEHDRAALLAGLAMVDAVILFDEDTPEALIAQLEPDSLVKGGDYDAQTLVGADLVRGRGGDVIVSATLPGRSTSAIIDRIRGGLSPLHTTPSKEVL